MQPRVYAQHSAGLKGWHSAWKSHNISSRATGCYSYDSSSSGSEYYALLFVRAMNLFPFPGRPVGCAPKPVWSYGPNQAELPTEAPDLTGLLAQLCLSTELLAEISAQVLLQAGMQSANM